MFWNYFPWLVTSSTIRGRNGVNCPFCPLEVKTIVWLHDSKTDIYVVTDLNPRQYYYRLLAVGSGEKWHRPWSKYTEEERRLIADALTKVVNLHEKRKIGKLVCIDNIHFSFPQHGHIQACFERYKDGRRNICKMDSNPE